MLRSIKMISSTFEASSTKQHCLERNGSCPSRSSTPSGALRTLPEGSSIVYQYCELGALQGLSVICRLRIAYCARRRRVSAGRLSLDLLPCLQGGERRGKLRPPLPPRQRSPHNAQLARDLLIAVGILKA